MTVAAHQILKRVRRELRLIRRILRADHLQRERWLGERLRLKREWEEVGRAGPPPHAVKDAARCRSRYRSLCRLGHQPQAMRS